MYGVSDTLGVLLAIFYLVLAYCIHCMLGPCLALLQLRALEAWEFPGKKSKTVLTITI